MDRACSLQLATDRHIDELMTWFPDAAAVDIWGGPEFRFPYARGSFVKDCCLEKMASYSLLTRDGRMVAFGQRYDRDDRAHLARLIASPAARRQGYGRRLIEELIETVRREGKHTDVSLFVYRHNEPAYRCYRRLGFSVRPYPERARMREQCYFLTRPVELAAEKQI
jgi:ribosomal protein S18 acetylase RimI-like enzyme